MRFSIKHTFYHLCAVLSFAAMGLQIPSASCQQINDWKHKIHPSLLEAAADGRITDFLVVMKEQPVTEEARLLNGKEQKGKFVFERLYRSAKLSQHNVLNTVIAFQAKYRSFWIVNAVWTEGTLELIEALARLPEVLEIQTNPKVRIEEPFIERSVDNLRAITWGISNIKADQVRALGYTGQGVVIGGQDTGYEWDNAALKEKYRGWNTLTKTANHNYNWHDAIHTFVDSNSCGINSPFPCDDHNHGTHTMGTMVGENLKDTFGVAPGAKWMACRNMDKGVGTPATYIECFEWFVAPYDLNGKNPDPKKAPHIINNSWSCPESEGCNPGNFATMNTVINNVRNAGIVVVVSAGNRGSNCATINAPPAIFESSFAVGATNSRDSIASFSSRGPVAIDSSMRLKPNVSAPGVGIYSTIRKGAYATWSGTSMSSPHVAATIALMISANPKLAGQVDLIESILESTSRKKTLDQNCAPIPGSSSPNNTFGHGIIDALEAVKKAIYISPLQLISFTGQRIGLDNKLSWETSTGGSLNHFDIEYQHNGMAFQSIGHIPFTPVLSGNGHYVFLHQRPGSGVHFYRLKMVDIDGKFSYSDTLIIRIPEKESIMLTPNPAGTLIQLFALQEDVSDVLIQLFDASGKLVVEKKERPVGGILTAVFDVRTFATGMYFIRIGGNTTSGNPLYAKFMKL